MDTDSKIPVQSGELLQKAAELLMGKLNSFFKSSKDSSEIIRNGKVGKTYKFLLKDHPDGALYVDIFPIKNSADTYYVDKLQFKGETSDGIKSVNLQSWEAQELKADDVEPALTKYINSRGITGPLGDPGPAKPDQDEDSENSESDDAQSDSNGDDEYSQNTATFDSTVINAKLRRVEATRSIDLVKITSSADPKRTMAILGELLDSSELTDQISDELSIQIVDEGDDSYDVQVIDDFSSDGTFTKLFEASIEAMGDAYAVKWACPDPDVQNYVGSLLWPIQESVDYFAKRVIAVEKRYPNPNCVSCTSSLNISTSMDRQAGAQALAQIGSKLVDCFDMYYVNIEHDEQAQLDKTMREIKEVTEWQLSNVIGC